MRVIRVNLSKCMQQPFGLWLKPEMLQALLSTSLTIYSAEESSESDELWAQAHDKTALVQR